MATVGHPSRLGAALASLLVVAAVLAVTTPAYAAPPAGSLDPSFAGGIVLGPDGIDSWVEEVVVQPDRKVVAVGRYGGGDAPVLVLRLGTDGTPDPSFGGGDGVALLDLEPGPSDTVTDVALAPDGKILLVGSYSGVTVARLTTDGSLDPTFGIGGVMTSRFSPDGGIALGAHDIAVRPDGRVVIGIRPRGNGQAFVAIQLRADGFIDPSFGTGGVAISYLPGRWLWPRGLVLDAEGRAVLLSHDAGQVRPYLTRFDVDGHLDPTFGVGGIAAPPIQFASDLALGPDGSLVVSSEYSEHPIPFQIAKLTPDGRPDLSFGYGSVAAVVTPAPNFGQGALGVAVGSDGTIVAVGTNGTGSSLVARLLPNGQPDLAFGTAGLTITPIGQTFSGSRAVAIDPDGDVVVGGVLGLGPGTHTRWMVARYDGA